MHPTLQRLRTLSRELKRRRVYRAAVLYVACGVALLQGADLLVGAHLLPDWAVLLGVVVLAAGFPVAVSVAWAFQLTGDGVRVEPSTPSPPAVWVGRAVVVAIAIIFGGGIGWSSYALWLRPTAVAGERPAEEVAPDPARLAVLYFDDHSPGAELGYLAAGLTESLLHELAQVPALEVVSRNAVKAYRDGEVSLDSLVSSLGIGSLVEGSVSRSGDRLKVAVQLVDATSGAHLDSRILERRAGELFTLESELAAEVARLLRQRLGVEVRLRQWRSGATSPEAWELLRRARDLRDEYTDIWKRDPEAGTRGLLAADSLLRRAEALDPEWANLPVARGWLAYDLSLRTARVSGMLDQVWSRRALRHADRAIGLQPDGAPGHELRGVVLAAPKGRQSDPATVPEAEAALRRAIALDPRAARAWSSLSRILFDQTRFAEARAAARHALEADAFLEDAGTVVLTLYEAALKEGPLEEARHWCAEGRQRFGDNPDFVLCQLFILASFPQVEPDLARAWSLLDTLVDVASARTRESFRGVGRMQVAKVAVRAGLPDSARAIVRRARGLHTPDWLAYDEAHVRLLLGDLEGALRLLPAYLALNPDTAALARDWWFESLRDDPRFAALLGS